MPSFKTSAVINCSAAALREFLGRTASIPEVSDPELELQVLEAPEVVTQDAVIDFRITTFGFKQRMQHRYITVSDVEIVAEQVEGPTRSWIHRQKVEDNGDGTCTLTDEVEFEPPGGMLGFVMTEDRIRESLEDGMEYRYDTLRELLE